MTPTFCFILFLDKVAIFNVDLGSNQQCIPRNNTLRNLDYSALSEKQ